jgi:hypothetical protein
MITKERVLIYSLLFLGVIFLAVLVFAFLGVLAGDFVDTSWDPQSPKIADWLQKIGICH